MNRALALLLAVAAAASIACGPQQSGTGGWDLTALRVDSVEPALWLLGTRVRVQGDGMIPTGLGTMTATLSGRSGDRDVSATLPLTWEDDDRASFVVDAALLDALGVDGTAIEGTMTVVAAGDRGVHGTASVALAVRTVSSLVPVVAGLTPAQTYPGELLTLSGDGFLLPGEGVSLAVFAGSFKQVGIAGTSDREGIWVPLTVLARDRATFQLTPDLVGLGPGSFEGRVTVYNQIGDTPLMGNTLDGVTLTMGLPYVDSVSPLSVRRGQTLAFSGKGFLGVDGELGTATFIAFTGTVSGPDGVVTHATANPLVFVPDLVTGNSLASLVLRAFEGPDGKATGLGTHRATLDGTFTPHVLFADRVVAGTGLPARLEIGRPLQMVHVRFLPTFGHGLRSFGLEAVADAIESRVIEVNQSDYAGISIEFRRDRPEGFDEYTVAEVMGSDPNGAGLLGLDNTFGKDVGNLRMADLIGGYNAESEKAGYYAYGGIFIESFLAFSLQLNGKEMASADFDRIFGPFMPDLGGRPVAEGEYPGGSRDDAIAEAVLRMGNLVGDTVSHEVGHALGLASVDGEYHDPGDNPGYIMDAGALRPFAERVQLPGAATRVFAPYDRAYLESILPLE